jgi:hypothetical protein
MTQLKDKIQNGLDESRMLILGAQILIGFTFTATFENTFPTLSRVSQNLNFIALTLLLITICLLISPSAFHQITEAGNDSVGLHRFTTHIMQAALLPFALAVGADIYIPADEIIGKVTGLALAASVTSLALVLWYGPILLRSGVKNRKKGEAMIQNEAQPQTSVHDKIRHVLTEARVILPGNQALLGFQLAVIFEPRFRDLPYTLKLVHLVSLLSIALSTILLLSPASYHRIVEQGEETERFYAVANKLVLCSLPPMAAGICGDFFVVVFKMWHRWDISIIVSLLMLSLFCGLWFGLALYRKNYPHDLVQKRA